MGTVKLHRAGWMYQLLSVQPKGKKKEEKRRKKGNKIKGK